MTDKTNYSGYGCYETEIDKSKPDHLIFQIEDIPLIEVKNKELGKQIFQSKLIIGNIEVANIKRFNKVQKYFLKKLLGIEVEDI